MKTIHCLKPYRTSNKDNFYFIHAGMIDYSVFINLQSELTKIVREDPSYKFVIFASHEYLTTMGRGDRQNKSLGLNPPQSSSLSIPCFDIKRGGGITLHGPHQWIVYPILKLSKSFGLNDYLCHLKKSTVTTLDKVFQLQTEAKRNPLGVWIKNKKLASIGIGIERFVTNHGLALNLTPPSLDERTLHRLNPCGLEFATYSSVDEFARIDINEDFRRVSDQFEKEFISLHQMPCKDPRKVS